MNKFLVGVVQIAVGLVVGCAASDAVDCVADKIKKVVKSKKEAEA